MQTAIALQQIPVVKTNKPAIIFISRQAKNSSQPGSFEKKFTWFLIKLRIFYFACTILKQPGKVEIAHHNGVAAHDGGVHDVVSEAPVFR